MIAAVMVAAFAWGWMVVGPARVVPAQTVLARVPVTVESMLAISGASAIMLAVGLSGFGYNYKAALLVLGIPLLARLSERTDRASFRAGVFMLVLAVIATFVTANALLASLAVLVSAAFMGGAALRPLTAWVQTHLVVTKSGSSHGAVGAA